MIQFAHRVWHRMFQHSHDVAIALMVEGSRANIVILLLMVAAFCVACALQVAFAAEEA